MQTSDFDDRQSFAALMNAAYHIHHGNTAAGRELLAGVLAAPSPPHPNGDLQARLFAAALMKACGPTLAGTDNIYTRSYAKKQIDLFDGIARSFPLIALSRRIANETLFTHIAGRDRIVIVDVGIGNGGQILELLELCAARGYRPRELTVVGIEPDEHSLAEAEKGLSSRMDGGETDFRFIPMPGCIEDLTPDRWRELSDLRGDLVVNEAYSLHHVRPDERGNDRKDLVLRCISSLRPTVFVLTEPHSNHESTSLFTRFRSAWGHYGLAFRAIDRLPFDEDARHAAKQLFFGREIEDVLASSESKRCERHELADMWIGRLVDSGFIPERVAIPQLGEASTVTASRKDLYVGLECEGETMVAVIAAKPIDLAA